MYPLEKLNDIQVNEDGNILRTSKAIEKGITKANLYSYIKDNDYKKVGQGLYVKEDSWVDEMYLLQLRFPRVIFSMDTALYLHGLSEMEPVPLSVTVPANYNTKNLINSGAKIYYTNNEWYEIGISTVLSPEGNILRVYDRDRTICDIIKKQSEMDVATFNYAINTYMRSKEKDLNKLIQYAAIMKIEKKLRLVIGVLL